MTDLPKFVSTEPLFTNERRARVVRRKKTRRKHSERRANAMLALLRLERNARESHRPEEKLNITLQRPRTRHMLRRAGLKALVTGEVAENYQKKRLLPLSNNKKKIAKAS